MRKILVVMMLSTVMLAGCAAQPAEAPSSPQGAGSTASEKPGAEPSATAPVATEDPADAIVAVDPAPYAGFTPYVSASVDFRTPSSNESCGIYVTDNPADVFWGCAPQVFDYALPQRGGADDTCPEQVHLTGGIESHNQDLPKLSCRNDAPFSGQANPDVPVLEAGTSVSLAGVTCVSGADAVTCTADSGRGFTLSRSAYSID
ncbi:hypothetical protein AB4Y63_06840 [Leifsonia sp. YAF41]|uniref:hypothetical protein n=1 Tax=Leifsonia sp. YAF41 TaxID=3233086 RepID=UPI003F9B22F0